MLIHLYTNSTPAASSAPMNKSTVGVSSLDTTLNFPTISSSKIKQYHQILQNSISGKEQPSLPLRASTHTSKLKMRALLSSKPPTCTQHTLALTSTPTPTPSGPLMVDAPVSGGVTGAKAGTLSFLVGGEADAFARAKPILELMGKRVIYCGPAGAGLAAKICNNVSEERGVEGRHGAREYHSDGSRPGY